MCLVTNRKQILWKGLTTAAESGVVEGSLSSLGGVSLMQTVPFDLTH